MGNYRYRSNNQDITGPVTLVVDNVLQVALSGIKANDGKADHFTLRADTPSAVTISYPLRDRARLDQNINIKANHTTEIVNIRAYGPIGDAQASCDDLSRCVPTLVIKIIGKIVLPPENTEAGILVRLLLSESLSPAKASYGDGKETLETMALMRIVLENRIKAAQSSKGLRDLVACNPATDDFRGIIFAHKCGGGISTQFGGYNSDGSISPARAKDISDIVKYANLGTHDKFGLYRRHVEHAIMIATGSNLSHDAITSKSLLYWRTEGSGKPAVAAEPRLSQAGQTFFSLSDGYLSDPYNPKKTK